MFKNKSEFERSKVGQIVNRDFPWLWQIHNQWYTTSRIEIWDANLSVLTFPFWDREGTTEVWLRRANEFGCAVEKVEVVHDVAFARMLAKAGRSDDMRPTHFVAVTTTPSGEQWTNIHRPPKGKNLDHMIYEAIKRHERPWVD